VASQINVTYITLANEYANATGGWRRLSSAFRWSFCSTQACVLSRPKAPPSRFNCALSST